MVVCLSVCLIGWFGLVGFGLWVGDVLVITSVLNKDKLKTQS